MTAGTWDVIVAGGGTAGLAAALMLGRARRRVLVLDAGSPRNWVATHMHGVLGQEGVPPGEFLERGRAEVASYGVELVAGAVASVERTTDGLTVTTADGEVRLARALVVATGLRDALPDVPGLAERWGATVLHCPYCHGWEVRDQHLGVLTTSPMTLHLAELVRQWSDRVTIFTAGLGDLAPETADRLRARGMRLEDAPVAAVLGEGTAISAVRLDDGREVPVDALFTVSAPQPHDAFLEPLRLERRETPFGSFLAVDPTGRTSDERIWATGNVVDPSANVPMSSGAGSLTGAAVNAALVTAEFDAAAHDPAAWPEVAPADYWEERYTGSDRVWSGKVNASVAEVASLLTPGRALDLGCGEGGDVIWLAGRGWEATGLDISPTAVARARAAAEAAGLDDGRARFVVSDLSTAPNGTYDLVTASFLHSPVALDREDILRGATALVAPGGHLLITSHAEAPPWSTASHEYRHTFLGPAEQVARLELDPDLWEVVRAEVWSREATAPDGTPARLDDVVVLVRRR